MSKSEFVATEAVSLSERAATLAEQAAEIAAKATELSQSAAMAGQQSPSLVMMLTVLVLACFVGYYVVWKVTPALHSPLMSVTNAISSVVIVGALIAAGPADAGVAKIFGFLAIALASINIFGGFIVTQRMLEMFRKK